MLVKAEEGKPQKGREKKRSHPGGDRDGGARRKRRGGGEEGERGQTDSGRKRLDALSVGYFRRVGERLGEGFENDEEKGKRSFFRRHEQTDSWMVISRGNVTIRTIVLKLNLCFAFNYFYRNKIK